jgi:hypothetical protein
VRVSSSLSACRDSCQGNSTVPSILQEKLSSPILKIQDKASSLKKRKICSIVVQIVLLIRITSPTVIFLPQPLVLLILRSLQIGEEILIHIRIVILFIIKFESALITDPNFLWEFCTLDGPSAVAHLLHWIIA